MQRYQSFYVWQLKSQFHSTVLALISRVCVGFSTEILSAWSKDSSLAMFLWFSLVFLKGNWKGKPIPTAAFTYVKTQLITNHTLASVFSPHSVLSLLFNLIFSGWELWEENFKLRTPLQLTMMIKSRNCHTMSKENVLNLTIYWHHTPWVFIRSNFILHDSWTMVFRNQEISIRWMFLKREKNWHAETMNFFILVLYYKVVDINWHAVTHQKCWYSMQTQF